MNHDGLQGWANGVGQAYQTGSNEYSHARWVISDEEARDIENFADIANKWLILANIDGSYNMVLVATSMKLLTRLFAMVVRDPRLMPIFKTMYFEQISELKATNAESGWGRKLQGGPGVNVGLRGETGVGGVMLDEPAYYADQLESESNGLFSKVVSRIKPRQSGNGVAMNRPRV